jgi:hypothetical protein
MNYLFGEVLLIIGCFTGNIFVGCLANPDDLTLLTATAMYAVCKACVLSLLT